jgi:uncharacterized protein YodC (DUF2158 family)
MEATIFKVQDSVQLLHGLTPTMIISEINETTQQTFCIWYDTKAKKMKQEWLPLNVLKLTPERKPINLEELFPKYNLNR